MPGPSRRVRSMSLSLAESNSLAARCLSHGDRWNAGFRFRGNQLGSYSGAKTLPGTPMRFVRSTSSRPIGAPQNAACRSHSESYGRGRVSLVWKGLVTLFLPHSTKSEWTRLVEPRTYDIPSVVPEWRNWQALNRYVCATFAT